LDVAPHMHLLGKSISSWAITPTNQTIPLIEIEDWDFHWQGFYEFRNPIKIPGGSTLHSSATYDNTTNNYNNPSNPPQLVTAGEATTDEMMLLYFSYTLYFPGDENIVIDPVNPHEDHVCTTQLVGVGDGNFEHLVVYPNPATDRIMLNLPSQDYTGIRLTDMQGKLILTFASSERTLDISDVTNGIYLLCVSTISGTSTRKVVVRH
jgi:hypothetical protein